MKKMIIRIYSGVILAGIACTALQKHKLVFHVKGKSVLLGNTALCIGDTVDDLIVVDACQRLSHKGRNLGTDVDLALIGKIAANFSYGNFNIGLLVEKLVFLLKEETTL